MKIVVGLGNPGPKYETTRHNVGFLAIDRLIDRWNATGPENKNQSEIYRARVGSEQLLLVKPQTFMNLSGRSVGPIFQFHKCEPTDLVVIHDDVDLPPMTLRLKTGGGTGGHNGLKSIDESIGKEHIGYHRIRIGVGKTPGRDTADHVLGPLSDSDLSALDPLLDQVAEAVELMLQGRSKEAMNRFNVRTPEEVKE